MEYQIHAHDAAGELQGLAWFQHGPRDFPDLHDKVQTIVKHNERKWKRKRVVSWTVMDETCPRRLVAADLPAKEQK